MTEGTLCIPCLEMVPTKTAYSLMQLLNRTERNLNVYLGKRSYTPVTKNNALEFMEGKWTLIIPNEAYFSYIFVEQALKLGTKNDVTVFPYIGKDKNVEYAFLVKKTALKKLPKPYFIQNSMSPLLNSEDYKFINKCKGVGLKVGVVNEGVELCHISRVSHIDMWKPLDGSPDIVGTIATPCLDTVNYEYLMSMSTLLVNSKDTYKIVMTENRPIAYARNYIVDQMAGEWIWWIDSDHLFRENILERLLSHNVPIAGAICYQKRAPYYPCIYGELEGDGKSHAHMLWLPHKPFEAYMTGTGCVVVRREVFDAIDTIPFFEYTKELGEDMNFFMKAKKKGFKILIDPSMRVGHMTSIAVDMYTYWRYNIEDLREMIRVANEKNTGQKIAFDESILYKKSTFSW